VNLILLLDEKATKKNITEALGPLARETKKEDALIIYLFGHGVGVGQQFYFLTHEMKENEDEEEPYPNYDISATAIDDALFRAQALKQILVLDTCESEAALPALTKLAFFKARGPTEAGGNGMVTVGSLPTYVNQQGPDLTEQYLKGKKQYPVTTTTGMDLPLAVR
jgi:hypothetical protein